MMKRKQAVPGITRKVYFSTAYLDNVNQQSDNKIQFSSSSHVRTRNKIEFWYEFIMLEILNTS
jgi:hypothetical protein